MKIPEPRYQCPLGRFLPPSMDTEQVKRDGWYRLGILVVAVEDARLDWMERELLKQLAERFYGPRRTSHD